MSATVALRLLNSASRRGAVVWWTVLSVALGAADALSTSRGLALGHAEGNGRVAMLIERHGELVGLWLSAQVGCVAAGLLTGVRSRRLPVAATVARWGARG